MERTIDFRPALRPGDLERLRQAARELRPGDRLHLRFERQDLHETDAVTRILEEERIGWQPRGEHQNEAWIIAGLDLTRPGNPGVHETPQREN